MLRLGNRISWCARIVCPFLLAFGAACFALASFRPLPAGMLSLIHNILSDQPDVVFIGSSFTGAGVNERLLEEELGKDVAVIGLGRAWGYQLEYLAEFVREELPDAILAVELTPYEAWHAPFGTNYRLSYWWDLKRGLRAINDGANVFEIFRNVLSRYIPLGRWREYVLPGYEQHIVPVSGVREDYDFSQYNPGREDVRTSTEGGLRFLKNEIRANFIWIPPTGMRIDIPDCAEGACWDVSYQSYPQLYVRELRWDDTHLNASGARMLAPLLAEKLRECVGAPS